MVIPRRGVARPSFKDLETSTSFITFDATAGSSCDSAPNNNFGFDLQHEPRPGELAGVQRL